MDNHGSTRIGFFIFSCLLKINSLYQHIIGISVLRIYLASSINIQSKGFSAKLLNFSLLNYVRFTSIYINM